MIRIGEQLKKLREKQGLTPAEVARAIKRTTQSYLRYERDLSSPRIEIFVKLAEVFNVSCKELLD